MHAIRISIPIAVLKGKYNIWPFEKKKMISDDLLGANSIRTVPRPRI